MVSNTPVSDAYHSSESHGYIKARDDYLKRLRRIKGQSRGLQRMIEENKYCIDILTQSPP